MSFIKPPTSPALALFAEKTRYEAQLLVDMARCPVCDTCYIIKAMDKPFATLTFEPYDTLWFLPCSEKCSEALDEIMQTLDHPVPPKKRVAEDLDMEEEDRSAAETITRLRSS